MIAKVTLYETKARLYLVGADGSMFRIAKIDRSQTDDYFLPDPAQYSREQVEEVLTMVNNGNKATGGLKKIGSFLGVFGFVRFLEGPYLILISKKSQVALIGGYAIHHVDDTFMFAISERKESRNPDELRYHQIFSQMDIHKNLYFSYNYDLTRSLQANLTRDGHWNSDPNELFVWNEYLMSPMSCNGGECWRLPVIHGFVDQSKIVVFGHNIFVTLIARRSRFFAGARFLKRGVNDDGFVANDVETEQIVSDASTTFFKHNASSINCGIGGYTSFLQHRGSIPLYWSQEANSMAAKPLIQMDLLDPFYVSTAKHFNNLFERYGKPVIVLNLVKQNENLKRESILSENFSAAINYLNQSLEDNSKIIYIPYDMARASKSADQNVVEKLEAIAAETLSKTNFFHSGPEPYMNTFGKDENAKYNSKYMFRVQTGIVRTNCIDCLDRTNAAQFIIGKFALAHQLYSLGVISEPSLSFDCDAVNLLNIMYHDHGDTIAMQYGGSHLVNTMETYRKISKWTSHSRDMIESIKRYYSNSFTDAEKQASINLFLGLFVPDSNKPTLWELESDFSMHNAAPESRFSVTSYINWCNPKNLLPRNFKIRIPTHDFFKLYYKPESFSSLANLFSIRMPSTTQKDEAESQATSPFVIRANPLQAQRYLMMYNLNIGGVKRWLKPASRNSEVSLDAIPVSKNRQTLVSKPLNSLIESNLSNLVANLLDPRVKPSEEAEYCRYLDQFSIETLSDPIQLQSIVNSIEMEMYQKYCNFHEVHANTSTVLLAAGTTYHEVYKKHIRDGSPEAVLGLGALGLDLQRQDQYQKWMNTGSLIPQRNIATNNKR